jgi:hypothetical protein
MPSLTHRAIVSSSGFTEAAQKKAAAHSVELYEFVPWTRPLEEQFPGVGLKGSPRDAIQTSQVLLCWSDFHTSVVAPTAPGAFSVELSDRVLDSTGRAHPLYPTFADYREQLLYRSTGILVSLEPARTVLDTFPIPFDFDGSGVAAGPAWPHTHTLDVTGDGVWIEVSGRACQLTTVTINGHLRWERGEPQYFAIQGVPDGMPLAASIICAEPQEGHMKALVFTPNSREIRIEFVALAEKHKNAIRRLKLDIPDRTSP